MTTTTPIIQYEKPKYFDFWGFLKLVRVLNLIILVFTQYLLKIFIIDEISVFPQNILEPSIFFLSLSTILIAAAGYIVNDYYDVKIDTINKPNRVVIGRSLKRRTAMVANFTFNFFALALGFWLDWRIGIIHFFSILFLWYYSNQLKRKPFIGNIVVASLTAMSILVVGIYYQKLSLEVWLFTIFSFFISVIREIIKDMEDVKGDKTFGCQTLPIIWGVRRTKQVIYVLYAIFSIILLSTAITYQNIFVLYLYLAVLPLMVYLFIKLLRADTKKEYHQLSQLCKLIMMVGVMSMILL